MNALPATGQDARVDSGHVDAYALLASPESDAASLASGLLPSVASLEPSSGSVAGKHSAGSPGHGPPYPGWGHCGRKGLIAQSSPVPVSIEPSPTTGAPYDGSAVRRLAHDESGARRGSRRTRRRRHGPSGTERKERRARQALARSRPGRRGAERVAEHRAAEGACGLAHTDVARAARASGKVRLAHGALSAVTQCTREASARGRENAGELAPLPCHGAPHHGGAIAPRGRGAVSAVA